MLRRHEASAGRRAAEGQGAGSLPHTASGSPAAIYLLSAQLMEHLVALSRRGIREFVHWERGGTHAGGEGAVGDQGLAAQAPALEAHLGPAHGDRHLPLRYQSLFPYLRDRDSPDTHALGAMGERRHVQSLTACARTVSRGRCPPGAKAPVTTPQASDVCQAPSTALHVEAHKSFPIYSESLRFPVRKL